VRLAIVSFAVLAGAFLGTAAAQPAEKGGGACRPDVEKFCKDVKPGGGRIVQCLQQHESALSGACRDSMEQGRKRGAAAKQRGEEFAEACKADAEKVCKGVQPGEGRVLRCLVEKKDQVSPACRQKIEEGERAHPCYTETLRLCKDVKPGEGRIAECLKRNESQLSGACKAKIEQERGRAPQGRR
jgi:hypothetical protein